MNTQQNTMEADYAATASRYLQHAFYRGFDDYRNGVEDQDTYFGMYAEAYAFGRREAMKALIEGVSR